MSKKLYPQYYLNVTYHVSYVVLQENFFISLYKFIISWDEFIVFQYYAH